MRWRDVLSACAITMCVTLAPGARGADADDWKFSYDRWVISSDYWSLLSTNPMQPSLTGAAKEFFALSEDQAASLEDLRQASETAWIDVVVSANEAEFDEHNRPWDSSHTYKQMLENDAKRTADLIRELDEMSDRFFEDIQLVLDADQQARWRDFDRDLRRTTTLARFASSKVEAIDLIAIVRAFDLDADTMARVTPELEKWADAIDPLVLERNRMAGELGPLASDLEVKLRAHEIESSFAAAGGQPTPDAPDNLAHDVLARAGAQIAKCDRIRALTMEAADRLAAVLPERDAAELTETIARCDRPPPPQIAARDAISRIFSMLQYQNAPEDHSRDMFEPIEARFRWSFRDYPVNAEPLTQDQIERLRVIRSDFVAECERLESQHGEAMPYSQSTGARSVVTPVGSIGITPTNPPKSSTSWDDRKAVIDMSAKLEYETKVRIRAVLTVRQRALVSFY